jgi:hypothetical protein
MRIFVCLSLLLFVACGERKLKDGVSGEEAFPPRFSEIRDRIIVPKCAGCHEEMMSYKILTTKYLVSGSPEQSGFFTEVQGDSMPPYSDKLLDEEKASIRTWIEKGAPLD